MGTGRIDDNQKSVAAVSGETIIAEISGETVKLDYGSQARISGTIVKISGETVKAKISGETVTAKVSGEAVRISGEIVNITHQAVRTSGQKTWTHTASGDYVVISGTVIANISGGTIIAKVSGETIKAKISGETVALRSGGVVVANISGETVTAKISGETVSTKISGEVTKSQVPGSLKTWLLRQAPALSGGVVLHSGATVSVTVKNLRAQGDIYLGGSTNRPYSGFGFVLYSGEGLSIDVDDFSDVYVFASHSGDKVSFIGNAW